MEILVGAVLHYDDSSPCTTPGIEVNFEISPDTLAAINSSCYTNEWGMVSNKLVYPTRYCNEVIQLTVSCGAIVDTFTFALPIAGAEINIDAEPQRLWAEQPGAYDTSFISCQLVDGVGNGIRNGKILFVALVCGEICGPQWGYTDDRGYAYTEYRMRYEDIPDGNNDPNSIETGVRGALFGYPDVEAEVALHCARP